MAAQLAAQTELKSIDGNALTLALPAAHKHLADKAYADKLKVALEQATGRKLLLAFEVGRGGRIVARRAARSASARRPRRKAEAAFRDEPFVRDLLARFRCEDQAAIRSSRCRETPATRRAHAHPTRNDAPMMKNQLAGLMKQAQQMQDNMKKAQEELAHTEVEGPVRRRPGQGRDDLPPRREARDDRPVAAGRGQDMLEDLVAAAINDAVRRVETTTQEKMAGSRRACRCRRVQAAVLSERRSAAIDAATRASPARGAAVEPRRAGARAALPAGRRAEGRAADGAASAAARPRRRACARAARCSTPPRRVRHCERCNTFTEDALCALCRSAQARPALLCVVETPADLLMVEQTQAYSGLYFVLMGRLSPLDGIGPKEIRLDRLLKRATDGVVSEVILATNFTNEGEATAHYIGELLTRARAEGEPARARRAGGRRARVRRRRHARAGAARAAPVAAGSLTRPAVAPQRTTPVRARPARSAWTLPERAGYRLRGSKNRGGTDTRSREPAAESQITSHVGRITRIAAQRRRIPWRKHDTQTVNVPALPRSPHATAFAPQVPEGRHRRRRGAARRSASR